MGKYISDFDPVANIADSDSFLLENADGVYKKAFGSFFNALGARIDNIVAGSASGASASEIIDARTALDGSKSASLGAAIRKVEAAVSNCEYDTYTTFDDPSVTSGTVIVCKKAGQRYVSGSITISGTIADWAEILGSDKVPAPQHGKGLYDTASQWGTSYARPLRIGIGAGGSLRIEYGEAGTYFFVLPPYPVEGSVGGNSGSNPGGTGADGEDGGYYTPAVSSAGVLSWTASKSDMAAVSSTDLGALIQTYVENAILGGTY